MASGGVVRGARGVGRVIDVLAVDVDGVGDKGGATVTAASVALLELEELVFGLDFLKDVEAHVCDFFGWFDLCGRMYSSGIRGI